MMTIRGQRRDEAGFRPDDRFLDKLNAIAQRRAGLVMIGVPLLSIVAAIVSAILILKTDLGYTQTAPGQRIGRIEDDVKEVNLRVDTLSDFVIGQNRIIRALGADWCFRANDTVRAISDVSCFDLTRGIKR